MGVRDFFSQEIEYKWGAVFVCILLILMVFPLPNSDGVKQGYGVAWAFGGGLRYIDEMAINAVAGGDIQTYEQKTRVLQLSDFSSEHPFWKSMSAVQKVFVSLVTFVIGGFLGALISGEFGLKFDREAVPDSIIGGLIMGVGISYMTQCNVGVFMGATTQLNVGAYMAIVGLIIGTYAGAKYFEKKMGL